MAPKRAHAQLGCALCAIHIITTFLDASHNDFGTFSFVEKESMFVGTEHKPGCSIAGEGSLQWKQWCQTGSSPWRDTFCYSEIPLSLLTEVQFAKGIGNPTLDLCWHNATKQVTGTRKKSFSSFQPLFSSMLNLLVHRAVEDLILSFFMPFNSIKANPISCNFPGSGMDFDL